MQLNGFEIEEYNQFNLPDKAKTSICPLCSSDRKKKTEKCMMLDWDIGFGTCQHCGEIIQLHTYKKKQTEKEYKKPNWENRTKLSENVVKWFENRKISQSTLKLMKISEGEEWMPQTKKEENTIQFNYFRDNELINIKYRDGAKNFKLFKDAEKIFYNLDNIRTTKEVLIVEGEIDLLSFVECGIWNVVSVPNGATKKNVNLDYLDSSYEYFENKEKIYLALDNDISGNNVKKELIRRLGIGRCFEVDFKDCKDANEYLMKYGKQKLRDVIENAQPFPIDDVVLMKDDGHLLDDFCKNGISRGFGIGRKTLDNVFTIDQGRFIVITGIPTHGKSTFVDEMVVGYNINYGWKICYFSPENHPPYVHKKNVIAKLIGYFPNGNPVKQDAYEEAKNYVDENLFFVNFKKGSYDLMRCLEKAKELIIRKGIKCIVLDPFNKIRLKESLNKNTNDYTNDYLALIDEFARENQITIILVAHPVKLQKKENGKYPIPDFYSIKGGGEFYDMSPFGLSVYLDFDEGVVIIKNLKVKFRHLGENQAETEFKYNINNGRYSPIINGEVQFDNSNYLRPTEEVKSLPVVEDFSNNNDLKPNNEFEVIEEIPF